MTCRLGFTRNDEQAQKSFEDWSQGKTMDHVLSSDMSSRLKDLLRDMTVTDLLSTAFPRFRARRTCGAPSNHDVEGEETLLDEVGVAGLPLEDFLRESALV